MGDFEVNPPADRPDSNKDDRLFFSKLNEEAQDLRRLPVEHLQPSSHDRGRKFVFGSGDVEVLPPAPKGNLRIKNNINIGGIGGLKTIVIDQEILKRAREHLAAGRRVRIVNNITVITRGGNCPGNFRPGYPPGYPPRDSLPGSPPRNDYPGYPPGNEDPRLPPDDPRLPPDDPRLPPDDPRLPPDDPRIPPDDPRIPPDDPRIPPDDHDPPFIPPVIPPDDRPPLIPPVIPPGTDGPLPPGVPPGDDEDPPYVFPLPPDTDGPIFPVPPGGSNPPVFPPGGGGNPDPPFIPIPPDRPGGGGPFIPGPGPYDNNPPLFTPPPAIPLDRPDPRDFRPNQPPPGMTPPRHSRYNPDVPFQRKRSRPQYGWSERIVGTGYDESVERPYYIVEAGLHREDRPPNYELRRRIYGTPSDHQSIMNRDNGWNSFEDGTGRTWTQHGR